MATSEQDFRDDMATATDADVAEACVYWQRRADEHRAWGSGADHPGERYADICRAELEARDAATTAKVGSTYTLPADVLEDVGQSAVDDVVAKLTRDVLDAGADPRSLTTTLAEDLEFGGLVIRVAGKVRRVHP